MNGSAPEIYVKVPGEGLLGGGLAKAHIRERLRGNCIYRYLVWRSGPGWPVEYYLGKVALQKDVTAATIAVDRSSISSKRARRRRTGRAARARSRVG